MQEQQQKQHRDIGQFIYKLWTRNGSDEAGYADAVFDGRLDALGRFMTRGEAFGDEPEGGGITRTPVQIDRRHCKDLSYSQFCDTYMFVNRPVVISGLSDHWKSRELWVAQNDDGNSPNLSYFQQSFGNSIAPVFEQNSAGFGTARPVSRSMSVGEYATWWHNFKQRRGMDDPTDDDDENDKATTLLYLKDWKFVAANPEYDAYEWPIFFRDDWLNEAMGNAYK